MQRYYYGAKISDFISDANESIIGKLAVSHSFELSEQQKNAWTEQVTILKRELEGLGGYVYFEFTIPRIGRRVDNIVIVGDCIFVIEFKVGATHFYRHDIDQVVDYAVDLKNFHEGSHHARLIPVLVSTEADSKSLATSYSQENKLYKPIVVDKNDIHDVISGIAGKCLEVIVPDEWVNSRYKPTPTIIEAAKALYHGHKVEEISRSDADAINLSYTTKCINQIIDDSKINNHKSICFVTGVPGSGKTLAGLNIAIERHNIDKNEHAVYLSGNGPLVGVLREALARDEIERAKTQGISISKKDSYRKASSFIQNIHHFRDDALATTSAPIEKVVIFDEAQRAWTAEKAGEFMRRKKGISDFESSEPEFLINVMNRHQGSCVIVCLVGGGQEINTGEAGIGEWIEALRRSFGNWNIYYSDLITNDSNYMSDKNLIEWLKISGICKAGLHLSVSLRSFRTEKLSQFVKCLLDQDLDEARRLLSQIKDVYPIVLTRNIDKAKEWLRSQAKGTERYGLVASSGALRLVPCGINVKCNIDAPNWFLNNKNDVRSSYFMELVATEFDIQGLELDWVGLCWDADLSYQNEKWVYRKFSGTSWMMRKNEVQQDYLKNAYRVLLTRARQGMVICVPEGDDEDPTRIKEYYDGTYAYLLSMGLQLI